MMNKKYFEIGKIYDAEEVSSYAKFMYYNSGTSHQIYSIGDSRLIFESTEKSDKLKYQVRRASLALWYFTKDYYFGKKDQPKIFSVIITLNGSNTGSKLGQYIDIISPYEIYNYITHRDKILSDSAIDKFVKIISSTY